MERREEIEKMLDKSSLRSYSVTANDQTAQRDILGPLRAGCGSSESANRDGFFRYPCVLCTLMYSDLVEPYGIRFAAVSKYHSHGIITIRLCSVTLSLV
jgi:hypothetical protein